MNRYARWVMANGGWLKAPHPKDPPFDPTTLHVRIGHRAVMMRAFGWTLRQCVNAERSRAIIRSS